MSNLAYRFVLLLVLSVSIVMPAHAGSLGSHEEFVYLDQQARLITLEGMKARHDGLNASLNQSELMKIDEATREEIIALFAEYGVTPSQHAAYGSRHAEEIEQWLENHPSWNVIYDDLQREFDSLSAAMR